MPTWNDRGAWPPRKCSQTPARGVARALGWPAPGAVALVLAALALTAGCGDGSGDDGISGSAADAAASDGGAIGGDTVAGDGAVAETTDDAAVDTGGGGGPDGDAGRIDPDSVGPICPGEPGCPCSSAAECDTKFCIETAKGSVCAELCVEDCTEKDFKCVTTTDSGGDTSNICVPMWPNLCNPCDANADCAAVGNADGACIPRGDGGAYCGVACSSDASCPEGYACEDTTDTGGNAVKQCVVKNGGACACSEQAIKQELSTSCFVSAGDAKCAGKRTCLPAGAAGAPPGGGLSACVAPEPEDEKCDAIDNDCDGQTDEATCDDNNPCTVNTCAGGDGCKTQNKEGDCDADDSVCTVQDTCKDGACVPGKALDCNDNNPCTADKCDPKDGCKYEPLSGPICNADDNECTQSDACKDGVCAPGAKKACDSGDECVTGACSVLDGKCTYTFQDGQPCNDGNPCTANETCQNNTCKGEAASCDDGKVCTTDACVSGTGCTHKPTQGPCDDGDACTKQDACAEGACVGKAMDAADCSDDNACTKDSCNPAQGCTHSAETGTPCDDSNSCTSNDICNAGKCQAGSNVCDCKTDADCAAQHDGNFCNGTLFCDTAAAPYKCKIKATSVVKCDTSINGTCQQNACEPKTGKCALTFAGKGVGCDADGSVCTQNDVCDGAGACAAGTLAACDDGNPCTTDACDKAKGCVYAPNSLPCNADDNACTIGDVCKAGSCLPGDAKKCDDEEPCTDDACDKQTAACLFAEASKTCDDGDACSEGDACGDNAVGKFTCLPGQPVVCDDGNACTVDSCDKQKGCVAAPASDGLLCDDGNACTSADACTSGKCGGAPIDVAKVCDDGNACTTDSCDSKAGCKQQAVSGKSCEDGDACSVGDSCQDGVCAGGTNICACQSDGDCKDDDNLCNGKPFCDKAKAPFLCKTNPTTVVTCDDSQDNFCAKNVCAPATGKCALDKKADKTPCDADSSVCTTGDQCQDGKCAPGAALPCDDLNPCTADACDGKTGCTHTNQAGGCDADGDPCTENDVCKEGKCTVGPAKSCDDSEPCTAELCDKKTGKCSYTELVQGCDDGKTCTVGDACGKNVSGSWTCLPGKAQSCDDGNVCTDDACVEPQSGDKGGCKYTIVPNKKVSCYTGPSGTSGKGECKDGTQTCDSNGQIGVCAGDVVPASAEACDNKDNTCDGVTDEGCAPKAFSARTGNASLRLQGANAGVDGGLGRSAAGGEVGPATGGKIGAKFGFAQWLKGLLGK